MLRRGVSFVREYYFYGFGVPEEADVFAVAEAAAVGTHFVPGWAPMFTVRICVMNGRPSVFTVFDC